jgi:hypothetical protein
MEAQTRRLLERYLDEVVESWGLCPWLSAARGDLQVTVLGIEAGFEDGALAAIAGWPADFRIGLVVMPASPLDPTQHRRLRDAIAARRADLAIADFHPAGGDPARALDSPARLVPILRRSPDPMLQVVPQASLAALAHAAVTTPTDQAAMLAGHALPPAPDPRSRIADDNFATVTARGLDRLLAVLDDIRNDRARTRCR